MKLNPIPWVRALLGPDRLLPCKVAGFPPFSNQEIRRNEERDDPTMPLSVWQPLWKEITTPPPRPELSRPAARKPCIWWNSLTGACKYPKYRPEICKMDKKKYLELHPEDDRGGPGIAHARD